MGFYSSKDGSHKTTSLTRSLSDGGILARFKYKKNRKNRNNTNNNNNSSISSNSRQKHKSLRLSNSDRNPNSSRKPLLSQSPSSPSSPQPQPSSPNNSNITNLPTIKLTSPYQLPEIESIKSSRSRDKSSNSNDVNEPRRSLQNSIAGIKQLPHHNHSHNHISLSHSHTQIGSSNTHLHGFFNIPVPIENNNNNNNSNDDRVPSNENIDTDTIITNNTTPTNNTYTNKPLNNLTSTPINHSDTEDTNNSTSIIGTILSFAHTAIGHHTNKTNTSTNSIIPSISNLSQSINGNHIHEDADSIQGDSINTNNNRIQDTSTTNANGSVIHTRKFISNNDSNLTTSTISNPKLGKKTNALATNVITMPETNNNTTKPVPNRSTSFLRHLDSLLSPTNPLLTNITSTSSLSTKDVVNNGDGVSALYTNSRKTNSNNDNDTATTATSTNTQSELTTLNKVKFESINSLSNVSPDPPTITTLGHGNLTLDLFEDNPSHTNLHSSAHLMSSDSLIMENNNNIKIIDNINESGLNNKTEGNNSLIFKNNTTNLSNKQLAATNRNSSYIDVSKHNPLSASNRERSKTLPTKDAHDVENIKRTSRYSSLSNDEHLDINNNNNNLVPTSNVPSERKSRSMSKTFLGRRSFSPNITKVIPNINLRPSMNRARNSTEVQESRNLSASFDNMIDPVVNFDYNKPAELVGIEYSSEKKNAEFHNLFKDSGISPDEKLIIDHSCALSRDILLQGRIYISNQHLCFYSNILGWVSSVIIPFKEIVQIEKKTTAGIFPNGIVIDTLHSKYIFASFISRDSTFDLITDVWNQIILGRRYIKMVESDENLSDLHSNLSFSNSSGNSSFNDEMDDNDDIDDYEDDDMNDTDMTSSDGLDDESLLAASKRNKSNTLVATTTNNFPGPATHAPTKSDYKPVSNERLISEVVINAPLGQVAQILYGDDVNRLAAILKAQANFDLSPIPPLLKNKSREYFYYKPLHFGFGPSKTKCLIVDKVIKYDLEDYVQVFQESKTPDVPSGNSFTIRTNTILTWDANNTTKVTTYFLAEWSSKSWLKGAIEKGAFDGVVNTTKIQNNEISKYVKEDMTKSSTRRGLSQSKKNRESVDENEELDNKLGALPTLGPLTHEPTEPEYLKSKNDVIISNDITFNVPLGTIFQLLYGDNTSYLKQILEKQNAFDISVIPPFTNKEREYKYIKKLNNTMGPKQTKCTITEKIEHMDINNYICVRQIVASHDVPSGNAFTVHTRFFFYWGSNNTTKMLVVLNVVWTGKSFIKGAIEKGSIDGQKSSTTIIKEQLNSIISNLSEKKTKKRSKTIRSRSTTTANKVEEPNKLEEIANITQEEFSTGIFNSIFSLWESFDIFSIKGIISLLIGISVLIMLFRSMFRSNTVQHDLRLVGKGRILIDGYEYTCAPTFKTLYQVYEDEIRSTVRSNKDYSVKGPSNVIISSQRSISKWLEERGYGSENTKLFRGLEEMNNSNDDIQTSTNNNKDYEIKKLLESIKITELQLNEMKDTLATLQS